MDGKINKLIGLKLRDFRVSNEETQDDIAQILSTHKASISNYENGTQAINIPFLYKLALHFNIDIAELLPTIKEVLKTIPEEEVKMLEPDEKDVVEEYLAKLKKLDKKEEE